MQAEAQISWPEVLEFLESRRGLLDGVVFSGGEPTLQPALLDAIKAVRSRGFSVGLHTAGMAPERFEAILPWIDWVGFDVKAPLSAYARITGVDGSGDKALASLRLLLASGIPYEARTTFHTALLSLSEMLKLRDQLLTLGVTHYVIQRFRSTGTCAGRLPHLMEQQQLDLPSIYGNSFRQFVVR
jgi:pyruvate formate lyase activating enzyme